MTDDNAIKKKLLDFEPNCLPKNSSITCESQSLLAKHLTPEIALKLKSICTPKGFSLAHAIASGIKNPDSSIGIYAGDPESYGIFAPLLDPIIEDYHKTKPEITHLSDFTPVNFHELDTLGHFVISTRIRVARNLDNFAFSPFISQEERNQVEALVKKALQNLPHSLKGNYLPLKMMDNQTSQRLSREHMLFNKGDRFMEAAGINREWPENRGVFVSNDKCFLVWVNEEDHLRIISMEKGGNLSSVFNRLGEALSYLSTTLSFACHDRYGYLTACPTNLGTGMRAGVHIKLPRLEKRQNLLREAAARFSLQIRGTHGEKSGVEGAVYDISNLHRLGITEQECIKTLNQGVLAIISLEKSL